MLPALLPAAGGSSRMGRPKLLLPWGDETVIGATVDAFERAGCTSIVVVTAVEDEKLAAWAADRGLTVATNTARERGMLSSILAGVSAVERATANGFLVCPADLPALRSDTVRAVLGAVTEHADRLALPVHGRRRGHPLGIPADLVPEIERLDPAVGLRQLLERHAEKVLEIEVDDPGCVSDVDTPEDYERLSPVPNHG